jgi:hypothetical protein
MCPEQLVALDTHCELRKLTDRLMASSYLPTLRAYQSSLKCEQDFRGVPSRQSIASQIAGFVLPAVSVAIEVQQGGLARHNRLMNIESIRDYASRHDRRMPPELTSLESMPAMVDPFTNQPMSYAIVQENGREIAELTIPSMQDLRVVRFAIAP